MINEAFGNKESWGPWEPVEMTLEMVAEDEAMLLRIRQRFNPNQNAGIGENNV